MASGTSFALPRPTPTCPASSPTTTRAEKLKRRPPFTTLATRLMLITRSLSFSSSSCSNAIALFLELALFLEVTGGLELESGLAGCVGQRLDASVVKVSVAIEDHLVDLPLDADSGD